MRTFIFTIATIISLASCSSNNNKTEVQKLMETRDELLLQLEMETDSNVIKTVRQEIATIERIILARESFHRLRIDTLFLLDENGEKILDPVTEKYIVLDVSHPDAMDTVKISNDANNIVISQDSSGDLVLIKKSSKIENVSISQKGKSNNNVIVVGSSNKIKNLVITQE